MLCFRDWYGSRDMLRVLKPRPLPYRVLYSMDEAKGRRQVNEMRLAGSRIGVIAECEWGGPQAAIMVEELAALGVNQIIGLGCGGGLIPDLARGAQVAVASAPGTDGTSRWYGGGTGRADPGLLRRAMQAADRLGVPLREVRAVTMDALYRETPAAVRRWRKAGGELVNMESGPFYLAARSCGVKALWLGHVSDRLLPGTWDDWHDGRDGMTRTTAKLCRATLEAL